MWLLIGLLVVSQAWLGSAYIDGAHHDEVQDRQLESTKQDLYFQDYRTAVGFCRHAFLFCRSADNTSPELCRAGLEECELTAHRAWCNVSNQCE